MVPLGIFEEPPPEDAVAIKSVQVKRNVASIAAIKAQHLLNEGADALDDLIPG